MQPALLFLVLLTAFLEVNAIIPLPCANSKSLTNRECCPVPTNLGRNSGPCGANLGRGSCEDIIIRESASEMGEKDVRVNWPIQYFTKACKCKERFGGYDCGECSYAYNDGTTDCEKKTIYSRKSVGEMSRKNWRCYSKALGAIKDNSSRYMVSVANYTDDPQEVLKSLVRPTTYNLFVWLHHLVAKDNEVSVDNGYPLTDYAHEGTGFPTWHRLFLLWLEREIQIEIGDHKFRLPYWDWSDESQREILFRKDRLGENVEKDVKGETVIAVDGDLFTNWETYCWEDTTDKQFPIPICNPVNSSNEILRRCPIKTLCSKSNTKWPSKQDVSDAVAIETYDDSPYDRYVEERSKSFRNFMEGFIVRDSCSDEEDTLCTPTNKSNVTRKLHNTVHIILGLGDLRHTIKFEQQGVMSCVAASPNDPVFINHHANIDCILEKWLQENKDTLLYPQSDHDEIRGGHRRFDYIVPFMPLHTHNDMFKTADNFGYRCSAFSIQAYTTLIIVCLMAFAIVAHE